MAANRSAVLRLHLQHQATVGIEVIAVELETDGPPYVAHASLSDGEAVWGVDGFGETVPLAIRRLEHKVGRPAA
jgi:hypothetical protein